MKYNIGQFIILTSQPDGGIWDGIMAEVNRVDENYYRIVPLMIPVRKDWLTPETVLRNHLFSDNWIYHGKSTLLNTLLERS